MSAPVPADVPVELAWLDAAIVAGEAETYGHAARTAIFESVRADPDGPVANRLLHLADDPRPAVRSSTMRLLVQLAYPRMPWAGAARVGLRRLADPDERTCRDAATLLATVGGAQAALAALETDSPPYGMVTRSALAQALFLHDVLPRDADEQLAVCERLRRDALPAVRFLASVETLRLCPPQRWPEVDEAIRADLDAAAPQLAGSDGVMARRAGQHWASALIRLDREEDCYAEVTRLLEPIHGTPARQAGLDLAVAAMRTWRAAPRRLAPVLTPVLAEPSAPLRGAVATVLSASLTATRLAADALAELLAGAARRAPALAGTVAVALASAGDVRAVPEILRLLAAGDSRDGGAAGGGRDGGAAGGGRDGGAADARLAEALTGVAASLPDPAPLTSAVTELLRRHPDPCDAAPGRHCQVWRLFGWLGTLGPAAAPAVPELIARLRVAIDRSELPAGWLVRTLGRIGPAAAGAVPLLRQLAARGDERYDLATLALVSITGDRAIADAFLDARPVELRRSRVAPELLAWLVHHGGLTARQDSQLKHLFEGRGFVRVQVAPVLWRHAGPAAATDLLGGLCEWLHDEAVAADAVALLADMGAAARPALYQLDELINRGRRVGFYLGQDDEEMRADERLLAAALAARDCIAVDR